jgi:fructose-bisphosphate aldolase class II
MSLHTFEEMLGAAQRGIYAIGSFNAWDIFSAKNIVSTAERMRSPVIISLWQPELDFAGEKQLYELCLSFAGTAAVPVALFIDHARSIEDVERAIAFGATSVMIDGSQLPLAENIACTAHAAGIAHQAGISIEGELGVLGEENGSAPDTSLFTDAGEAEVFVEETGVDALAIAIGNAHGRYREVPKLDFDRLALIRSKLDAPLVLHGGSGIPPDDMGRAIDLGITKVNIGVEARSAFMKGLREALEEHGEQEQFPHRVFPRALEYHAGLIAEKMQILRSSGRA